MATDANDTVTGDLIDAPKRRGRPPTGDAAMSAAERQNKRRQGKAALTVLLTPETAHAFREYLRYKNLTQNEVIEKLIVSQLLRKR